MALLPVLLFAVAVSLVSSVQPQQCGQKADKLHLAHVCAEPEPINTCPHDSTPVIMLHGMTDIKNSWEGLYQNLSILTNRKVCIYDARNHGESSWTGPFTVDDNAEDLGLFMDMLKIEKAFIVGHSMGGLTAMRFALTNPDRVKGIFVEDCPPSVPKDLYPYVTSWIEALNASTSSVPPCSGYESAKKAILDYLEKNLEGRPLPNSYFTNFPIRLCDGVWKWKNNLEAIDESIEDVDKFLTKMDGQFEGKALFIYGNISIFHVGAQEQEIRELFPAVKLVPVEGAGHIIHHDFPEFMNELVDFLK